MKFSFSYLYNPELASKKTMGHIWSRPLISVCCYFTKVEVQFFEHRMLSTLLMLDHSLTNLAKSINLQLDSANIKMEFKLCSNFKEVRCLNYEMYFLS